jgi:septal ring factor EnvC (AmiA/AmiB activator)
MMRLARLFCLVLTLTGAARADTGAGAAALAAMAEIEAAATLLAKADEAPDRVAALTKTTRAFELGLAAMREGLRQVSAREAQLTADLAARDGDIAQLLGTLEMMGGTETPVVFLHPSGAVGTARAAMIVADVSRALDTRAAQLRSQLNEVKVLRQLQESAARTLAAGLRGVQEARTELSQAIGERTDLPRKFTEDPIKTALLITSTETLAAFASGLSDITENETPIDLPTVTDRKGTLPLPALGRVLRRAGEADAAGIVRQGVVLATRPRAIVTTPTAATIRYRGPLLDLGNVMILEPETDILFVFAGLDVVYGDSGDILPAGAPVGLMGGDDPDLDALLTAEGSAEGSGNGRSETLYIEVRQNNSPQDPAIWFRGIEE